MGSRDQKVVVGGDFNAKCPMWGSPHEYPMSEILMEWMASRNLVVMKSRDKPTFERGTIHSHIDVTMVSEEWDDEPA